MSLHVYEELLNHVETAQQHKDNPEEIKLYLDALKTRLNGLIEQEEAYLEQQAAEEAGLIKSIEDQDETTGAGVGV